MKNGQYGVLVFVVCSCQSVKTEGNIEH